MFDPQAEEGQCRVVAPVSVLAEMHGLYETPADMPVSPGKAVSLRRERQPADRPTKAWVWLELVVVG